MIRRRCTERNCKNGRKCLEHLRFDLMFRGKRYRIPVNEFAIPRMEAGKQRPIQSMEEARDWERRFIGEIKAGRDPRRARRRTIEAGTHLGDVSAFLDAYIERCVKPAGLRSVSAIRSRVGVLKEHLGTLPLIALEEPDEINQFKTDSEYAEDVEIATMHRVLETLRAAMNWGMAQTPPLFNRSPFHRFGVRLNKKAETARDRRLTRDEEKRLLDAALAEDEHRGASVRRCPAPRSHHRRPGALLPPRRDAADAEQARELGHLPDRHSRRDRKGQREPSNPVQPERTDRGDSQATGDARTGRLRVRQRHRQPTSRTSRPPGKPCGYSRTASIRSPEERVRHGIESSSNGSISAGTTCATKAPADCSRMASTSGSFN